MKLFMTLIICSLFVACNQSNMILTIDSNNIQAIEIYSNENLDKYIFKIEDNSEQDNLINVINESEAELVKFRPSYRIVILDSGNTEVILFNDEFMKYNSKSYRLNSSLINELKLK